MANITWNCSKCGTMCEPQFGSCWKCGTAKPGFVVVKPQNSSKQEIMDSTESEQQRADPRLAKIFISTCAPIWEYDIIDTVFAIDTHEQGFFSSLFESQLGRRHFGGANPGKAFDGVKIQLKEQCFVLGGDGVIFCQFEHRVAAASGMFGPKQAVEIFAYGTVIKRYRPNA